MRYVRFTATPDPDARPELFDLIAATSWITETRLINWNLVGEHPAGLFVVTGDHQRFVTALDGVPEVIDHDSTTLDAERFAVQLLLSLPSDVESVFDALTTEGLILVRPIVYRDGSVYGSVVGQPAEVRTALDGLPSLISLSVEEISAFDGRRDVPTAALSPRQLEAVRTAVELGYYETPRRSTHTEIAAELGCAPSTTTEHLQKGQAKLITSTLGLQY